MSIRVFSVWVAVLVSLVASASARAGDTMAELQERFKQRYAQIQKLKTAGTLGETYLGYLGAPAAIDDAASALMNDENADRKKLYTLIADKEETTPEKVAERNAVRNFGKAQSGEYLKGPDGSWKKKA